MAGATTERLAAVVIPFRKDPFDWETLLPGPVKGPSTDRVS